jgi:hypothetical protein
LKAWILLLETLLKGTYSNLAFLEEGRYEPLLLILIIKLTFIEWRMLMVEPGYD